MQCTTWSSCAQMNSHLFAPVIHVEITLRLEDGKKATPQRHQPISKGSLTSSEKSGCQDNASSCLTRLTEALTESFKLLLLPATRLWPLDENISSCHFYETCFSTRSIEDNQTECII